MWFYRFLRQEGASVNIWDCPTIGTEFCPPWLEPPMSPGLTLFPPGAQSCCCFHSAEFPVLRVLYKGKGRQTDRQTKAWSGSWWEVCDLHSHRPSSTKLSQGSGCVPLFSAWGAMEGRQESCLVWGPFQQDSGFVWPSVPQLNKGF